MMMNVLIVYDSVFGNTEALAKAMALALGANARAVRVGVCEKSMVDGAGLVVVGSPTRAFSATPALKAWLKALPPGSLSGKAAAAFDTRVDTAKVKSAFLTFMVRLFGYAAEPLSKRLAAKGASVAAKPEGFFVEGTEGPLSPGESDRAAAWIKGIAL